MKAAFDLHFHSCLSPCGDGAMTPATIAGLCKLAGLDVAALTDHNTCGNCAAFCQACQAYGLLGLPGMELCTAEEVHVVCLLPDLAAADAFSRMVYDRLPPLENDRDIFGPQRCISLCRELTKLHEEVRRTTLGEAAAWYEENPPKGEFVLVVEGGCPPAEDSATLEDGLARLLALQGQGCSLKDAARQVAAELGLPRKALYDRAVSSKKDE